MAGKSIYNAMGVAKEFDYVAGAAGSALVLVGIGLFVRSQVKKRLAKDEILPDDGWSFFNTFVQVVSAFRSLLYNMIGKEGEKFLPVVLGTFLLILFNNVQGMLPMGVSASANLINNFSMAIVIFLFYQYLGIKEHGFGYLSQFTGGLPPKGQPLVMTAIFSFIALVILFIELIGHAVRPVSLSLRLWGTITGDKALFAVTQEILPFLLPLVAMAIGLLVSVVQAFVFSLLSTVYIKLAVSHDH